MSVLTPEQRSEISSSVEEIHLDLRWVVGDHPDVLRLLDLLARRMYLAGLASRTPVIARGTSLAGVCGRKPE